MTPSKYSSYILTYTMYLQRMEKSADATLYHGQWHRDYRLGPPNGKPQAALDNTSKIS